MYGGRGWNNWGRGGGRTNQSNNQNQKGRPRGGVQQQRPKAQQRQSQNTNTQAHQQQQQQQSWNVPSAYGGQTTDAVGVNYGAGTTMTNQQQQQQAGTMGGASNNNNANAPIFNANQLAMMAQMYAQQQQAALVQQQQMQQSNSNQPLYQTNVGYSRPPQPQQPPLPPGPPPKEPFSKSFQNPSNSTFSNFGQSSASFQSQPQLIPLPTTQPPPPPPPPVEPPTMKTLGGGGKEQQIPDVVLKLLQNADNVKQYQEASEILSKISPLMALNVSQELFGSASGSSKGIPGLDGEASLPVPSTGGKAKSEQTAEDDANEVITLDEEDMIDTSKDEKEPPQWDGGRGWKLGAKPPVKGSTLETETSLKWELRDRDNSKDSHDQERTNGNATTTKPVDSANTSSSEKKDSFSATIPLEPKEGQRVEYDRRTLRAFDKKFREWEQQFEDWKQSNLNHPDQGAYNKYMDQWNLWRQQLIEQRRSIVDRMNDAKLEAVSKWVIPSEEQPVTFNSSAKAAPPARTETFTNRNQRQTLDRGPKQSAVDNIGKEAETSKKMDFSEDFEINGFEEASVESVKENKAFGFNPVPDSKSEKVPVKNFTPPLPPSISPQESKHSIPPLFPPGSFADSKSRGVEKIPRDKNRPLQPPPPSKKDDSRQANMRRRSPERVARDPHEREDKNPFEVGEVTWELPNSRVNKNNNPFEVPPTNPFLQSANNPFMWGGETKAEENKLPTLSDFLNKDDCKVNDNYLNRKGFGTMTGGGGDAVQGGNKPLEFEATYKLLPLIVAKPRESPKEAVATVPLHAEANKNNQDGEGYDDWFTRDRGFNREEKNDETSKDTDVVPAVIDYGHGAPATDADDEYAIPRGERGFTELADDDYVRNFDDEDIPSNTVTIDYGHTAEQPVDQPAKFGVPQPVPFRDVDRDKDYYYGREDYERNDRRSASDWRPTPEGRRPPLLPIPSTSTGNRGGDSRRPLLQDDYEYRGSEDVRRAPLLAPGYEREEIVRPVDPYSATRRQYPPPDDYYRERPVERPIETESVDSPEVITLPDSPPPPLPAARRAPPRDFPEPVSTVERDRWDDRDRYAEGRRPRYETERHVYADDKERRRRELEEASRRERERRDLEETNRRERERRDKYPRSRPRKRSRSRSRSPLGRSNESRPPPGSRNADTYSNPPPPRYQTVLIEDILNQPGRAKRPPQILVILRGLPGCGKSFVAKLIKDKEVEMGGSAPRVLSLDDYFMQESEKGGKTVMEYEYEVDAEPRYRSDLVKTVKKTVENGYFPFIVVDSVHDQVRHFEEMATYATQRKFLVYIAEVEDSVETCVKRNIHNRTREDITKIQKYWERTPSNFVRLDVRTILQDAAVQDVEMEDVSDIENDNTTEEVTVVVESSSGVKDESNKTGGTATAAATTTTKKDNDFENDDVGEFSVPETSKWEKIEPSEEKLNRLDGLARKKTGKDDDKVDTSNIESWLQSHLPEDYVSRQGTRSGQKRVRWADIEERRTQERMRDVGFVVGHTDWNRMMDPTFGSSALTRTKYI